MGDTTSKRTPLYPMYEKYGARTIDFGGWEMPVQFAGILQEHEAVRNRAGLFDVSHMGEIVVSGEDAETFLQHMMTNHISKLQAGQIQYTAMCYPEGGTIDDLLVYKQQDNRYMLVVNAANAQKDWEWLKQHQEGNVHLEDISEQTALLALQGPKAEQILQSLTEARLADIRPFTFRPEIEIGDIQVLLSRTGYTGEDGFEMYVPASDAIRLWELLMDAGKTEGLVPVGLGARDTLRFEAKLPLYGQELSPTITPLEAGLGFAVKLDQGEFIGRTALLEQKQQGVPRKIVGIKMIDRGIPRSGYPVYIQSEAGEFVEVGQVTTGTQSPTLKKNVGLVLIASDYAQKGQPLFVEIRRKKLRAEVVPTPFYKRK